MIKRSGLDAYFFGGSQGFANRETTEIGKEYDVSGRGQFAEDIGSVGRTDYDTYASLYGTLRDRYKTDGLIPMGSLRYHLINQGPNGAGRVLHQNLPVFLRFGVTILGDIKDGGTGDIWENVLLVAYLPNGVEVGYATYRELESITLTAMKGSVAKFFRHELAQFLQASAEDKPWSDMPPKQTYAYDYYRILDLTDTVISLGASNFIDII